MLSLRRKKRRKRKTGKIQEWCNPVEFISRNHVWKWDVAFPWEKFISKALPLAPFTLMWNLNSEKVISGVGFNKMQLEIRCTAIRYVNQEKVVSPGCSKPVTSPFCAIKTSIFIFRNGSFISFHWKRLLSKRVA